MVAASLQPFGHAHTVHCAYPISARTRPLDQRRESVLIRLRTALASLLPIAAVIGGGAYALSSQPGAPAVAAPSDLAAVPVVAEPVKTGDVPIYLRGIGTVQAYNTDTIHTQVQGQITEVAFKEG